jgi:hypothetical protein
MPEILDSHITPEIKSGLNGSEVIKNSLYFFIYTMFYVKITLPTLRKRNNIDSPFFDESKGEKETIHCTFLNIRKVPKEAWLKIKY